MADKLEELAAQMVADMDSGNIDEQGAYSQILLPSLSLYFMEITDMAEAENFDITDFYAKGKEFCQNKYQSRKGVTTATELDFEAMVTYEFVNGYNKR